MAKVKIYLEANESELDASHTLMKALDLQISGKVHDEENFSDPAMVSVVQRAENIYSKIYKQMVDEISAELDKEYQSGNQ